MPRIHIDPREFHLPDNAPRVHRLHTGMEEAIAQARVFYDARLILAQAILAFPCSKPAPDGGAEHIATDLFTR